MKDEIDIKKELNNKVSKVFLFCPRSEEMKSYRKQVYDSVIAKFDELVLSGKSKQVSYDIVVETFDQFYDKDKINQLEQIKGEKQKTKPTKDIAKIVGWSVLSYLMLIFVVFFSIGVSNVGWRVAGITIGCFLLVPVVFGIIVLLVKTKIHSAYTINRFTIWITSMSIVTLIYLIISFSLNATGNFNYIVDNEVSSVWALTWLTFMFGLVVTDAIDLAYRVKEGKRIYSAFDALVMSTFVTLSIYLSVSMIMDIAIGVSIWSKSWVILFAGIFVYSFMMLIRQILKLTKQKAK